MSDVKEKLQEVVYRNKNLHIITNNKTLVVDVFLDTLNIRHEIGVYSGSGSKILLVKDLPDDKTLVVYSENNTLIYYIHTTQNNPLGRLVSVRSRTFWLGLNKWSLRFITTVLIEDPYKVVKDESLQSFYIANDHLVKASQTIYHKKLSRLQKIYALIANIHYTRFSVEDLLTEDEDIPLNTPIRFRIIPSKLSLPIFNQIAYPSRKYKKNTKLYYAPLRSAWVDGSAIHVRRSKDGRLVLVRRPQEMEETTKKFQFFESRTVSIILYSIGVIYRALHLPKINIYFEKFASKAEEGAYEVFLRARKESHKTKQFFIIKENMSDSIAIRDTPGVLFRDTIKAYLVIYCASSFITTEAPAHVTSLRSNNRYLRLAIYRKKFVFLQHGVTYLKRHGAKSAYVAGKEAEPSLIVAGGDWEIRAISEMLEIPQDRILKTGLPIFDKITHDHITQKSADIATVMLTWRPYEEHIADYTKTTYYQFTKQVFHILEQHLPVENIRIVAHPKVFEALQKTDLSGSLWTGSISEVLGQSKLLITDYSSVCYNSFYQGGAVIFYQPDLEVYEDTVGSLVPKNDEYIGPRVFTEKKLEDVVADTIADNKINLSELRRSEYIHNYQKINEFTDGKNVERIIHSLKDKNIL